MANLFNKHITTRLAETYYTMKNGKSKLQRPANIAFFTLS